MIRSASTCVVFLVAFFFHSTGWGLKIIVDPGHGGHDKGASKGDIHESHIVLKVGLALKEKLKKDRRFEVSTTRHSDEFVPLSSRTDFAKNKKGDIFLSIHVNASPDPRARGGEFYFQNQLAPDEESMYLASLENEGHGQSHEMPHFDDPRFNHYDADIKNIIFDLKQSARLFLSSELSKTLVSTWQGVRRSKKSTIRQAPFYVVSYTDMPAALVELGYLSNPREAKKLTDPDYQKRLADGLYKGLIRYKEFVDKDPYSRLN